MGDAGAFLAGLLGGVAQAYGESAAENKRISLLKTQIANQNAQFGLQLSEAAAARKDRNRLEDQGQRINLLLGMRGGDIDLARIGSQEKMTGVELAARMYMQEAEHAARRGDMDTAERYRALASETDWARGEISADRGVDRNIRQAEGVLRATQPLTEASQKRMMDYEANIRKGEMALGSDLRKSEAREADLADTQKRIVFNIIETGQASAEEARAFSQSLKAVEIEAEKNKPGDGARMRAFFKTMADEMDSAKGGQPTEDLIRGMQILTGDPKEAAMKIATMFGGADFSRVGKGITKEGRINLTKEEKAAETAPTGKTDPISLTTDNELSLNLDDPKSIKGLVDRTPWLKQAVDAQWGLVTEGGPSAADINQDLWGSVKRGVFGHSDADKTKWLAESIRVAPGKTITEKLHNAVRQWSTFKNTQSPAPAAPVFQPQPLRRG